MDAGEAAAAAAQALGPALPYLLAVGKEAWDKAKKELGEGVWDRAKSLWDRLRGADADSKALERLDHAAGRVVARPEDANAKGALVAELHDLLEARPALLAELAVLLEGVRPNVNIAVADRGGAVAQGGSAAATGGGHASVGHWQGKPKPGDG
ncbi:MAG TPA: hypothetical protein VF017_12425 [Thermoanaerobaculia bacterium]|nr:hypothetical protein [Thermoanaerobaculia bacterium]